MIVILKNKEDDKTDNSADQIVLESIPKIEKIGDFLFDMLKLEKKFLLDSTEIQELKLVKNEDLTLELENKYGLGIKDEPEILNLTIPKQHVNQILEDGILIYITERKVLHPIIESPSWVKGLREDRYVEFELSEDFIEDADPENDLPSIMFKIAKKDDVLYEFLYAVSRGILIFIKSSI